MAQAFVCIGGPYRPDQPRVSKLAATLSRSLHMKVHFLVTRGTGPRVVALGGSNQLRYIAEAASFLRKTLKPGDLVLGYGHAGALAGYLGTRHTPARFWYDYPDPWRGWYHHRQPTDSLRWALGRRIFAQLEKRLYREADVVTAASFGQRRFLEKQHGSRNDRVRVILNCPDTRVFKRTRPARINLAPRARIVMYLGSILEEYGCETLVRMMPHLVQQSPDAHLVFLGSAKKSGFLQQLKDAASHLGVSAHVHFLPPVPSEKVPAYLSAAEAGFVPFKDVFYNRVGSPNKLFEYMACGVVPIASDLDEFHHYLKDGKNGLLVEADDAPAFSKAAMRILSDRRLQARMRRSNDALVRREYNWATQEKRLVGALACLR